MNLNLRTTDFVILGAGVMGTSIAFQLAKRKAGRIVVIEKEHVGRGASGRSSALVRMHYTFEPEVQLALRSFEMFRNWQEISGGPGDFHRIGFVQLVAEKEIDLLRANVEMQKANGVNVELMDNKQLKLIEPDWYVDDIILAAYEPESGYGDGAGVANDFLERAREMGVEYRPRTRATSLLVSRGEVEGVATEHGEIRAPIVIAAMGQWTKALLREADVDLPITTEYHEVAILKNPMDMRGEGSACIDSILCVYFRSEGHDKTLVGAFTGRRGVDPDNFPQRASEESLAAIAEGACRRIPKLQNAELVRGITGVYDLTPDYRPILGEIPEVRGLYVAAGFSGMGFKLSPAIGVVMAELLLQGRAKTVDITPFRPSRFAEGNLIRPQFEYAENQAKETA
jgi:sarcosine oxidase subunit beta